MTQHTVTQHFAPPQPVCRILARIGDERRADYAEQFPQPMLEMRAFDALDSDAKANTGFVATLAGKFIAAYEIVTAGE